MKEHNKSNKPGKDKFTVTEVGTLVEQLRSEFHIFGEDLITVKEDVDSLKEMVTRNTEQIALLSAAVKEIVVKIDALTKSIDNLVKTKLDRVEFQALEKRVSILEAKLATSK